MTKSKTTEHSPASTGDNGVPSAIRFERVSGGYHRKPVFADISFELSQGEMAAVIGPNGSGKTTLLRAVTGLLPHVDGKVTLFGHETRRLSAAKRAGMVGVVPQNVFTPMAYSVEEVVAMGRNYARPRWRVRDRHDRELVEDALRTTDVGGIRHQYFNELSGGERQRVMIAMVLAQDSDIILMDEATAHLDINHRLEIMDLVLKLNRERGRTILMVSHDLNLAAEYFGRLLLVSDGHLVADGGPEDVLTAQQLHAVYGCDAIAVERNPHSGAVMIVRRGSAERQAAGGDEKHTV